MFGRFCKEFDDVPSDFSFHERTKHYMRGQSVTYKNRATVELRITCEGGGLTMEACVMNLQSHAGIMKRYCKQLIKSFNGSSFSTEEHMLSMQMSLQYDHKRAM